MQRGYSMTSGSRLYFMPSTKLRKTVGVVNEFIERYCKHKGICDDLMNRCKNDKASFETFRYRLTPCTLEVKTAGEFEYYHIEGKNFIENMPLNDNCVFII
jgi:hypothetical protein